jgi:predicted  nucleic acid-binding Zn-ribbon protein
VTDLVPRATDGLLALAAADAQVRVLAVRRDRLAEREAATQAVTRLAEVRAESDRLAARAAEVRAAIAALDREGDTIDATLARLRAQLRTVIAPREAEALQREIATGVARRSSHDDAELALMEESEALERSGAAAAESLEERSKAADAARGALGAAEAALDAEAATVRATREAAAAALAPATLRAYEARRARMTTSAAAALEGAACGGCHLDVSARELAALRALAPGELPECPNCGCILVVA